jgi:hypothetical protein
VKQLPWIEQSIYLNLLMLSWETGTRTTPTSGACVLAYERGDWEQALSVDSPFDEVGGAYLSALDFATSIEEMKIAA